MFYNLGLKLKVFFFIAFVFVLLSMAYVALMEQLIANINVQSAPKNTFKYLEQSIRNNQFVLISNSFEIGARVKINSDKKSKNTIEIPDNSKYSFVVVDQDGKVEGGTFNALNSFSGVPAVMRAVNGGVASDGYIQIDGKDYLMGVAPVRMDSEKKKNYAVVSLRFIADILREFSFDFPVQAFSDNKMIFKTNDIQWNELESGRLAPVFASTMQKMMDKKNDASDQKEIFAEIDRWSTVVKFTMPKDPVSPHTISFVVLLSKLPGYDKYLNTLLYIILAAGLAIVFALIFTFIVTLEIDRQFKNLAADISKLKVGEKLLMKKYTHGAGTVVSAMNHLIAKQVSHDETNPGVMLNAMMDDAEDFNKEQILKKEPIKDSSFDVKKTVQETRKPEIMPKIEKPEPPITASSQVVATAIPQNEEEESEKTQIAQLGSDGIISQEKDPYSDLWGQYKKIKIANNETVNEQERASFLAKLKSNKASIIAKYNCRDVSFAVEEKDGKPVIKAKPVK